MKPQHAVAAVLNYRRSSETVRQIVEILYVNAQYSLAERIAWAGKKFNPYPAEFSELERRVWEGEITCGLNPWLWARLVDDLHVEIDEDGRERLLWTERPRPRLPKILVDD